MSVTKDPWPFSVYLAIAVGELCYLLGSISLFLSSNIAAKIVAIVVGTLALAILTLAALRYRLDHPALKK